MHLPDADDSRIWEGDTAKFADLVQRDNGHFYFLTTAPVGG
jgi:hypothetical protein